MASGIVFKWYWAVALLLLVACKKPEDRRCWKASGETVTVRVPIDDFAYLNLKKKLHYVLVEDDSTYLIITGGKNLIKHISWGMNSDGFMVIENTNKCNFLRDEKKPLTVEIHFKTLGKLKYEGSESLNTPDTLHLPELDFTILDACGSLNMLLDVGEIKGDVAYGWGDYKLSGIAKKATFGVRSNGYANVENLKITESLVVNLDSPGDLYVNADQIPVSGYISGKGNVYYSGNPTSMDVQYLSKGRMIKR